MSAPRPYALLAELTYRCPLRCPYCSNPIQYPDGRGELTRDEWGRVFAEAAEIGVLHVHLSGGEPLLRSDLGALVTSARGAGLYTNLITSGVGLDRERADELRDAGLDSVQVSFQAEEAEAADLIAGVKAHATKIRACEAVRGAGLPLSLNVVLHRSNIDRIERLIAFAEELGGTRLELANTQFYGWAFENRAALLPTREQVERADEVAAAAKIRLRGKMEILYVLPDYYGDRPKPCMNGWGRRSMTVNPVGDVLPCPTAYSIKDLDIPNARDASIRSIWADSPAFNRFRGSDWMPEPCRSCDLREIDFGGCRCQAALLTGDPNVTDPACSLSPYRETLTRVLDDLDPRPFASSVRYRANPPAALNASARNTPV